MKKMYALIMCMMGRDSALFAQTEADFDTEPNGDGVVITKYKGKGGAVVIPATIGGKPVVGIGAWAFAYRSGLTSITIPDSVTRIDEGAFVHCTGLTSITIPDSVTSIDEEAFAHCKSLSSVTILGSDPNFTPSKTASPAAASLSGGPLSSMSALRVAPLINCLCERKRLRCLFLLYGQLEAEIIKDFYHCKERRVSRRG